MEFINNGICPICGKKLRAMILPSGEKMPMSCECERANRRQLEYQREELSKKHDIRVAEAHFLETIGARYKNKTLLNYQKDKEKRDDKHYHLIMSMATRFEDFLKKGLGGLVFGNYGCGKTHLEVGLGRALIQKGYTVNMYEAASLYTKYMAAFSWRHTENPEDIIKRACNADLIIIDDIGTSTLNSDKDNFVKFIYQLINYRYNQKKPVLISTNLKVSEFKEAVTLRVFDRIIAMTYCVVNKCPSRRPYEKDFL